LRRSYYRGNHATYRAQHKGKRVYRSKSRAWRACWRIWLQQVRLPFPWDSLHPYECAWRNDYTLGRTNAPHWHIGHDRYAYTIGQRIHHWRLRLAVWPYYRLRARWRNPDHFRNRGRKARVLHLGFGGQVLRPLDVVVGPLAGWPELD
jgi:hypothetical protein